MVSPHHFNLSSQLIFLGAQSKAPLSKMDVWKRVSRQLVYGQFAYDISSTDISSTDISSTDISSTMTFLDEIEAGVMTRILYQ